MESDQFAEDREERANSISEYNHNLVKQYIKNAKVTCCFVCIALAMFLIEVVMTWTYAS
jgi:hypothetical protein